MYTGDGQIEWMDKEDCQVTIGSIEMIYQKYQQFLKIPHDIETLIGVVDIPHNRVMIREGDGWTEVDKIKKYKVQDRDGFCIRLVSDEDPNINTSITVDASEIIPMYDDTNKTNGFHGDVKYDYLFMSPERIGSSDKYTKMLYKTLMYTDLVKPIFITPKVELVKLPEHMYEIYTKSRFCTINNIYLFTNDFITTEEAEKTFKKS